jgi:hypothetical protein
MQSRKYEGRSTVLFDVDSAHFLFAFKCHSPCLSQSLCHHVCGLEVLSTGYLSFPTSCRHFVLNVFQNLQLTIQCNWSFEIWHNPDCVDNWAAWLAMKQASCSMHTQAWWQPCNVSSVGVGAGACLFEGLTFASICWQVLANVMRGHTFGGVGIC